MKDIVDIFAEYETELEEKTKREIAEEDAVWKALPQKMKDIIKKTHDQGKKVRVYNCPEEENVWEVLLTAGVDFINSPNPERFSKFLASRP